jgi:hypothetical protein
MLHWMRRAMFEIGELSSNINIYSIFAFLFLLELVLSFPPSLQVDYLSVCFST